MSSPENAARRMQKTATALTLNCARRILMRRFIGLVTHKNGALSEMRRKKWISWRGAIQRRYGPTFSVR